MCGFIGIECSKGKVRQRITRSGDSDMMTLLSMHGELCKINPVSLKRIPGLISFKIAVPRRTL